MMSAKHLVVCFTAAALLASASAVGIAETEDADQVSHIAQHLGHGADTLPAAVRQATARYLDVQNALDEEYVDTQNCVSGQNEGAMGVHLIKLSLFDHVLRVEEPEALVYEPKDGRLRLVAVEYITPAAAWQTNNPGAQPILSGHLFHYAQGPNRYGPDSFYELHVWAWKNNPRGTFADWNPNVSCAGYEAALF
jgi:hypothetical protein